MVDPRKVVTRKATTDAWALDSTAWKAVDTSDPPYPQPVLPPSGEIFDLNPPADNGSKPSYIHPTAYYSIEKASANAYVMSSVVLPASSQTGFTHQEAS